MFFFRFSTASFEMYDLARRWMGKAVLPSMAIDSDASLDGLDMRRMACLVGLSSRPSCEPLAPTLTAERGMGLSDLFLAYKLQRELL